LLRVVKKGRRKTLDSSDIAKLLRAAEERPGAPQIADKLKAFILISANTGMRYEEALHLQWRDIDFEDRRLDIHAKRWSEVRGCKTRECFWSPKSHQERSVWARRGVLFDFLKGYRIENP
jgi:integrase